MLKKHDLEALHPTALAVTSGLLRN